MKFFDVRLLYILSVPFIDVLGVSSILPLPLISGFLTIFFIGFLFDKEDIFLFLAIVFMMVPYIWNINYVDVKVLMHLIALIASITVYYFLSKSVIRSIIADDGLENLISCIAVSLFFVSLYIILEFFLKNFTSIGELLTHNINNNYESTVLTDKYRPRGFSSEPGIMSIFYEMYIFILFYFYKNKILSKASRVWWTMVLFFSLLAFLFLFSSASFFLVGCGVVFLVCTLGINFRFLIIVILLIILLTFYFHEAVFDFIQNTFLNKISFLYSSDLIGSASERSDVYKRNLDIFIHNPFGIGFGLTASIAENKGSFNGLSVSSGQISLFLTFLVSGGVISILLFFGWLFIKFKRVLSASKPLGYYLIASLLCVVSHFFIVSEFWIPFFWLSVSLTEELSKVSNDKLI